MGYTHYWTFKHPKGIKAADLEAKYQQAILECAKVAQAYNNALPKGDPERLSGYTAHTKPGTYGGLDINGKGEYSHDSFQLREHFSENIDSGFGFCKTARRPYDTVVTACLSILKYRLGDAIEVSSDGRPADWVRGVFLARTVTKRAIKYPIKHREAA